MRSRPIRRAGQLHSGVTHPGVTPFDASPTDILDAIKAAIIITDSVGVIRYINPFAKQLYGWSLHEVIGRNIMEIAVSKENKEQAEEHMAALKAGDSWAGEFQVRCKDGRYVTAMVTLSPLFDEDRSTTTIVGISLDMSGRQRVEDALREARAELETRVQERSAELERANERLRNLSARLLQLRDHEGRRLARELHDSVGQLLTAITIDIATVQSQAGKLDQNGAKALEDSALLVQQISSEIRTISHLLHPPLLDEVGLPSALGWYLDGFGERSKIATKLEIPDDFGRHSQEIETAIFRIVQECLTNIHRHSGSTTAVVRIRQEARRIIVVVQDSGRGIPSEKMRPVSDGQGGVGFRGMVERVGYLGGKLEIQSDCKGTMVTVMLPLEQSGGQRVA